MSNKIETIFSHTTDDGVEGTLGIDRESRLYWNEKAIITEQIIKLQLWVNISIIVASSSTLAIAIFTVLQYFYCGPK